MAAQAPLVCISVCDNIYCTHISCCSCASAQSEKLGYVSKGGNWVWHVVEEEMLASSFSMCDRLALKPHNTHTWNIHPECPHGLAHLGTGALFSIASFCCSAVSSPWKRVLHFKRFMFSAARDLLTARKHFTLERFLCSVFWHTDVSAGKGPIHIFEKKNLLLLVPFETVRGCQNCNCATAQRWKRLYNVNTSCVY